MEKLNCSYKKDQDYLEDMSKLIAKIERLDMSRKLEPEECNISCPPFGCPLGPCPGMSSDNDTYNPCRITTMPSKSQQHAEPSSLPDKYEFFENLNHASTSTTPDICLLQNHPCDSENMTQICYPPVESRPNWQTSVMGIPENFDYTPRLKYYSPKKPFRSHCPPNGPPN